MSSLSSASVEELLRPLFSQHQDIPQNTLHELSKGEKEYIPTTSCDFVDFFSGYSLSGFQATEFSRAVEEINKMLVPCATAGTEQSDDSSSSPPKCCIWLSSTSNLIYSGLRQVFVYLMRERMINVFVTSSGSIEADILRSLSAVYILKPGHSNLDQSRFKQIGNLLLPDTSLTLLYEWMEPVFEKLFHLQEIQAVQWTPSKVIQFLGQEINDPGSVLYWCHKNEIPVFCPGFTDGLIGTCLLMHSMKHNKKLHIDVVEDIRRINDLALYCKSSGIIVLGGGSAKHHTCNANLMRNGADFAVYINTAQEYDGSDSGATPDEAVAWGKIRAEASPVKISCDATVVFPLLVSLTFAKQGDISPN